MRLAPEPRPLHAALERCAGERALAGSKHGSSVLELDAHLIAVQVGANSHCACEVDVDLPEDEVVDCGGHLVPRQNLPVMETNLKATSRHSSCLVLYTVHQTRFSFRFHDSCYEVNL